MPTNIAFLVLTRAALGCRRMNSPAHRSLARLAHGFRAAVAALELQDDPVFASIW
jgi:hypothetical protein